MDFYEILDQVIDLLKQRGRITYRTLRRQFALDDEALEDLKEELLFSHPVVDEAGRGLVWTGDKAPEPTPTPSPLDTTPDAAQTAEPEREPLSYTPAHLAEKILTSRSALEGERKQVTVLFCDLQNSTPLAEKIGPENMHGLLNRFFEIALSEVHRYEGTINQFLGDGLMALFGAPIAHEDHARRAVLSAIGLQQSLKEAVLGEPYSVECAFRIGINSGLVVVASIGNNLRMDYTAVGDTTNLASRLQTQCEPGEILVSEATARLIEGYIRLEALEPVEVKGKTEPVSVYKVLGSLPRRSPIVSRSERTLSQFVGRERELATLEELFVQGESGNGQVVGIVAEAGQGKSRLLYEFRQRLQDKQVTYLEGRCLSYGSSIPYHPIIDIVRNNCGITEMDNSEAIIAKVGIALREVGIDAETSAPYLLRLLGVQEGTESISMLTPEAVRTRTFDTLRQMSLSGAQRRPLIFEVEDIHWCDKTSEDYMASLVESLAGASILLLTTYRPGYQPSWIGKSYATQLSLHHLVRQDALTIVHSARPGGEAIPDELAQTIVAKAEGNPFFLEELTRAVIEQGDRETTIEVPDTIQGVLSARIDRLPEVHKRLLQTASVLGREFSPRLLGEIWEGSSGSLEALLSELKRMEFLFERTRTGEPVHVFRHALTQGVAYESLLTTRRQTLHAAAGTALEALYPNGLTERSEELAHHFRLGEVWDKAFVYLARAGDKARQAYANQEAIAFYTHAIDVSGRIQPALDATQLFPVYEGRGLVWKLLTKYDEAIANFQQMRQLARTSGNPRQEGESLYQLASAHHMKQSEEHLRLEEQCAQQAIHLAQQTGDQHILARSLACLGQVQQVQGDLQVADRYLGDSLQISQREGYTEVFAPTLRILSAQAYWQGHFQRAIRFVQESIILLRDTQNASGELTGLAYLCLAAWSAGHYAQAFTVWREGMQKAQERDSQFIIGRLTNTQGWFHRELGDLARAVEYNHESIALGRTTGIANVECSALINLGFDYLALGQHARAVSYLAPTLDRVEREAFGAHRWRWKMKLCMGLGELFSMTGEYDQALRYMEEGLKEAQLTNSQKYIALGWVLRGKIAAQLGDTDAAGIDLQRAFTLADQLQSPSLLYPIAYDLGQWHERTGKEREAASLYGKAKTTIEQMATAVEDEALRSTFLQSALVQEIHEHATRLGG